MDYKEFWIKDRLSNLRPAGLSDFQGGWHPGETINNIRIKHGLQNSSILDFGCGAGRLSYSFDPRNYTGVDLNPHAIERALEANPGYRFREVDIDTSDYPFHSLLLAYTVFNHLDPDTIHTTLGRLKSRYVLQCEILGEEWATNGPGLPAMNKSYASYESIFANYTCIEHARKPFEKYRDYLGERNIDMSFILWRLK